MSRILYATKKSLNVFAAHTKPRLPSVKFIRKVKSSATCSANTIGQKAFTLLKIYESSPKTLCLKFQDKLKGNLHYIWLRDNCQCETCIHPITKQKRLDTILLQENLKPETCALTNDGKLEIVWPSKEGGFHKSVYDPVWLHKYTLGFQLPAYVNIHDILPPVVAWDRSVLKERTFELHYDELMSSIDAVNKMLDYLYKYGLVFVRNAPCKDNEVIKIVKRFTYIKNTICGASFQIANKSVKPDFEALTLCDNDLELHTDMNYLEKSPGILALHCLESHYPGEFYFVDGYDVANWMKDNFPSEYHMLISTPVKFKVSNDDMDYVSHQRVLKSDSRGGISEVYYHNGTMAPLEGPSKRVAYFYKSYIIFGKRLRQDECQYSVILKPGDVAILNNRRVLHGRNKFDPSVTRDRLEVCYGDIDEVVARFRHSIKTKLLI